jgi:hypothetical protein
VPLALGLSKDDNSESCLRPTCSYNITLLLLLYSSVLGALLFLNRFPVSWSYSWQ